jgi:hypothetical protein
MMVKTNDHKINILLNDSRKTTAFGKILHLSSRLNLDERNRYTRLAHWIHTDVQRTPCHCHSEGMNQVGLQQLNQGVDNLPANCEFPFPISLANFRLGTSSFQKGGYLVSLFFGKLCRLLYQCSSDQDFGADEIPQLTVILPLMLH